MRERQQRRQDTMKTEDNADNQMTNATDNSQGAGVGRDRVMADQTGQTARPTSREGDRQGNVRRDDGQYRPRSNDANTGGGRSSYGDQRRNDDTRTGAGRAQGGDRPNQYNGQGRPRQDQGNFSSRGPRDVGGRDNRPGYSSGGTGEPTLRPRWRRQPSSRCRWTEPRREPRWIWRQPTSGSGWTEPRRQPWWIWRRRWPTRWTGSRREPRWIWRRRWPTGWTGPRRQSWWIWRRRWPTGWTGPRREPRWIWRRRWPTGRSRPARSRRRGCTTKAGGARELAQG
ncbi:hypothetical protein [Alicyclobacillus fastidiosus]|uniref:hypothetical protein n=1 Tax=Alicyclobacillus fastidiosus TaxID=392011 RepID=UPI0024E161A2|nr:hypothetical protein [Alicyclobacillus fastidiosus]